MSSALPDFLTAFQSMDELLRGATKSISSKIDQISFKLLVNCLKSSDRQAVIEALNQLEKERRPIAIPPIYFLSQAHPDPRIRARSTAILKTLDPKDEIAKITNAEDPQTAVKKLIEHYGNFRG